MKILYPNLTILNLRCDSRDNIKEQCSCISIVVHLKTGWFEKKRENNMKDIIRISIAYWRVHLR